MARRYLHNLGLSLFCVGSVSCAACLMLLVLLAVDRMGKEPLLHGTLGSVLLVLVIAAGVATAGALLARKFDSP